MYSYAWGARIRMFKGYRSKSFPPDRLSPLPKSWFFHFATQSLKGRFFASLSPCSMISLQS